MAKAKQPVNVDGIEFDALIDEETTLSADIPEFPVETGFVISDTITIKPILVSMTLYVSNTPVTWKSRFGNDPDRVNRIREELQELHFQKQLVTLSTTDRTMENMGIEEISFRRSTEIGYALEIPIQLKEVRFAESELVSIPDSYGKGGASESEAGTASVSSGAAGSGEASGSSSDSSNSGTMAYNLASAAGIFK